MPKYATNSDDPAERFMAVVAMALDSVAHAEDPGCMIINTSAATISLARRDFYEMLAEQGEPLAESYFTGLICVATKNSGGLAFMFREPHALQRMCLLTSGIFCSGQRGRQW